jgi:hypothetical protein
MKQRGASNRYRLGLGGKSQPDSQTEVRGGRKPPTKYKISIKVEPQDDSGLEFSANMEDIKRSDALAGPCGSVVKAFEYYAYGAGDNPDTDTRTTHPNPADQLDSITKETPYVAAPELLKAARDLYLLCTPDASIEDMAYRTSHKDEMMERARIIITKAGGRL